jgi:hypothetical protein
MGCISRVFVGRGGGWVAEAGASTPTAEVSELHLAQISAFGPCASPLSIDGEVAEMRAQAKVSG